MSDNKDQVNNNLEVASSSNQKSDNNQSTTKSGKVTFFFRVKRFYHGLIKEGKRISWARPKELGLGMVTVLTIMIILTAIFYGLAQLIISTGAVS